MAVTAAKSVMAFRVLTMAVDLCRLTTRTMNVNAGHERTSKARIIHQIQLIRGITQYSAASGFTCAVCHQRAGGLRLHPGRFVAGGSPSGHGSRRCPFCSGEPLFNRRADCTDSLVCLRFYLSIEAET
ncbi:glutamate decarboxylase isozyme [Shigella dysenteriae 1617]|nr:glutamate decarboxylase isozyme [Shigella dysenteriae 1617]